MFTSFSGYDSQCLALERLKVLHPEFCYELVGWSEIEENAITAHNVLFPEAADKNYGDISKIDYSQVPDFDLFTYSSPCQDWSSAGLQRGGAEGTGTRSSLLWECRRAIVAKKPKYLMLENVAALVSEKFMPFLKKWMDELASYGYTNYLAPSFDMPWETGGDAELHTKQYCLNAKNYGVPQNRERVFLISILGEHDPYQFPKPFPLDKCLMDVLEKDVDEKYYIKDEVVQSFIEAYKNGETPVLPEGDDEGDEDGLFDEEIY